MNKREAIVLFVCVAAVVVCAWSLSRRTRPQLFGSEAIRLRLRFPHWLVIFGALASLGMLATTWFELLEKHPAVNPKDSDFLRLATVLVLFMLFGFVAFEAGTVSSAYRNRSAEKNLLVIMFSLASYLCIGRFIHDRIAGEATVAATAIVFQAGFACTVSLIISNALTERASTPTNVLCAIFSAGLGYPVLAGLVWGDLGLLRQIGFVDASGASAVHLLGAAASLTAAAAVGSRVRLQRWRYLGWPDTPDFSSPWSVVGGLFLMFGWLGFNIGIAASDLLRGHAFFNTIVGACSGALAAWVLSRGVGPLIRWTRWFESAGWEQTTLRANIEGLKDRPRIVIGMMGGLVAVTANGALLEVDGRMAAVESFVGGFVAVMISTWMSERSRAGKIDDPLGVIGTHGCAAIVGILFTALWLAMADARLGRQGYLPLHFAAQLIGCGVCIVVGWLVAMLPCWLLLTIERRALVKKKISWMAVKLRLRLGAIEQLGTPLETPPNLVWKYRIEEAAQRILADIEGDLNWWEAVQTYATAAEVLDKSLQAKIAQRILEKLPETAGRPDRERVALVALSSSAEYQAKDIRKALRECLSLAESNGNSNASIEAPNGEKPDRKETLVWSIGLLTERAAVLKQAGIPGVLPQVNRGLDFLRKVTEGDENHLVQDLARTAFLDANARLYPGPANGHYGTSGDLLREVTGGPFDTGGQWRTVYALVTNKTALPMLLFLADRGSAMIAEATEEFRRTPEDMLETAKLLESHGLISFDAQNQKMTIKDDGRQLVKRLRHSGQMHESL